MTVIPTEAAVAIPYEAIRGFCEKHHIVRLWLFGSVLRDDFHPHSDIDLLVEFDPEHVPGWEFSSWIEELREIFGRSVDLTTPDSLSKYIKKPVMQSARLIYERT
jgi:uncharacterized protein